MKTPPIKAWAVGLAVALAGGAIVATVTSSASAAGPAASRRFIVELAGAPAIRSVGPGGLRTLDPAAKSEVAASRRDLSAAQDAFLGRARTAGVKVSASRKLGLLVNAVAVTVPAGDEAKLRTLPGVARVYPDTRFKVATDVSVPLVGAPTVWARKDAAGANATGRGVTVAIIDSGVDYTHPDLGGCFGAGCKVVGGWDFANNDADPADDNGHGTHVAGIIAGRAAEPGGITGVAPDATIMAYKAMDAYGMGLESDIVAAIEAAVDPANPHRADVINMSLGSPGDGSDPVGQAATAAVAAGVVVVASAGNDGPGRGTVGSPATAPGVIAVGASTSNYVYPTITVDGSGPVQGYRGAYSANPAAKPAHAEMVDAGYGAPEDWARVGDVTGKIVLLQTPVAPTVADLGGGEMDTYRDLEARGALALIGGFPGGGGGPVVFGAGTGDAPVTASPATVGTEASGDNARLDKLVVLGVDGTQYDELSRALANGPVTATLAGQDETDRIAYFSSRGPSASFGLKPDLVAPGWEINSTAPAFLSPTGQYRMSGTSMAGPHVAGAAVLLRQLHPGEAPADVKSALVGTGKHLAGEDIDAQGGGRLDIAAAASVTVTANPASISFGLADMGHDTVTSTATVTLRNSSAAKVTIALTATSPAAVTPASVTLAAGASKTVTVTVSVRRSTTDRDISGYVNAKPGKGPAVHVPYLLVERVLTVTTTPDPSDGHSTVYVNSATPLAVPPVLAITGPDGKVTKVTTTRANDVWFLANLTATAPGVYRITATGTATTGQRFVGVSAFEVSPAGTSGRFTQVGPYDNGGQTALTPAAPKQAVVTQDNTVAPWLTTDGGATWRQLGRLPVAATAGPHAVIVDAKNPDLWWYALNDAGQGVAKILRTADGGRTWATVDVPGYWVTQFVGDPETGTLAALVDGSVVVSTDGGDTWRTYPVAADGEPNYLAISGADLYIAAGRGVWRMSGITGPAPGDAEKVYDTGDNLVWSLAADDEAVAVQVFPVGVVVSTDGFKTSEQTLDLGFGGTGLYASGGDIALATYNGNALVSHDHGRHWDSIDEPSVSSVVVDYDKWTDGSVTVATTSGIYRRAADGSYTRIGVSGQTVHALAVTRGQLIAGTDNGTYRTPVPADAPEWGVAEGEGYVGTTVSHIAVSPADPDVVFRLRTFAFGGFAVERSDDAGQVWNQIGAGGEVAHALLVDPVDPDRIWVSFEALGGVGLFATTDGGGTWKNLYHDQPISALAGTAKALWIGTAAGLYKSTDGGVSKKLVVAGQVGTILVDGSRIVVGGHDNMLVSTDGGRTFRKSTVTRLDYFASTMVKVGTTLYAGTAAYTLDGFAIGGRGVLKSTDGGLTWRNISTGLANPDVRSLVASADGKWLFLGTENGGVYRLRL